MSRNTLLEVENLSKTIRVKTNFFTTSFIEAVKPVSFTLEAGQTLAIIGESSAGKSTLVKMIAGMLRPSSGEIIFDGKPLHYGDYTYRSQHIRMIFQDLNTSFNSRQVIGRQLETSLRLHTNLNSNERVQRVYDTLSQVGLLPVHANYLPSMLSSGQQQRVALARAFISQPQIIIVDEALTALDLSVRSQLINLMLKQQEERGVSYIYIMQHLGLIKHISDQLFVMQQGEVIERGNTAEVLIAPLQDLTKRLINSHFNESLTVDSWQYDENK